MSASGAAKPAFISGGQILSAPSFSTRVVRFFDSIYLFFGLYFVSLFALDSYGSAQNSQFNISLARNRQSTRSRWGGGIDRGYGGGGGGGGGPSDGGNGGGGGGRKIGRIDDIREPECKSCQ